MVAKCKSNENGQFPAQLELVRLMSGGEIDNVFFSWKYQEICGKNCIVFLLTKALLYATAGHILLFKPYQTIFVFCGHLLLTMSLRCSCKICLNEQGFSGTVTSLF